MTHHILSYFSSNFEEITNYQKSTIKLNTVLQKMYSFSIGLQVSKLMSFLIDAGLFFHYSNSGLYRGGLLNFCVQNVVKIIMVYQKRKYMMHSMQLKLLAAALFAKICQPKHQYLDYEKVKQLKKFRIQFIKCVGNFSLESVMGITRFWQSSKGSSAAANQQRKFWHQTAGEPVHICQRNIWQCKGE